MLLQKPSVATFADVLPFGIPAQRRDLPASLKRQRGRIKSSLLRPSATPTRYALRVDSKQDDFRRERASGWENHVMKENPQ
jgi:hypothetical protein